ncbi:hypothetical protein PIB30_060523 [Stylosanthes scabra]|uniref:Uncharacterized protein n=1 Tax=Stylosanthes scabra TaxID=79078 RepID=A0ABU6TM87_9FABA|nr:hypothetical protein [Stylosanthes scabra]
MKDVRDGELQRLEWLSETLRKQLLHKFATDLCFLKRLAVNKVNRASSKGGCLHTGVLRPFPRLMRSLDRPPTEPELFRETHTWKRDINTKFFANFQQATQQTQEEGDESAGKADPNIVWRQTLSEPHKNRVYRAGGFFASSLRTSGYGGSSASATSTHTGPATSKVVDLREQVQNSTQSLETQGQVLQQYIDEVRSLNDTLAERDAWAEVEEM